MQSDKPTPWAVRCQGIDPTIGAGPCTEGLVFLTKEEYIAQMSNPWKTWRCPRCGGDASWDDDNYEEYLNKTQEELGPNYQALEDEEGETDDAT